MKLPINSGLAARTLLLVGGGHTHSLFLRMLGMSPIEGLSVNLVSDVSHTAYSGMLPGYIAGTYSWEKTHIDLPRLCKFSKANFIQGRASGVNLDEKLIQLESGRELAFDLVSFDIGSTPAVSAINGADEYAIPVKPIPVFIKGWQSILNQSSSGDGLKIVIVGGGAGGVELSMAMQKHLVTKDIGVKVQIVHREDRLLNEYGNKSSELIAAYLEDRGIDFALNEEVVRIEKDRVLCKSGHSFASNATFLVTSASAPQWPGKSGLDVDVAGFIKINRTLQSTSHPFVFASGDIASFTNKELPKAGVFAVRQARPLFNNIKNFLENKKLKAYKPQQKYLSLLGTSTFSALASRGKRASLSSLMWLLKDHIDRKFMRQFEKLPEPKISVPPLKSPDSQTLKAELRNLKNKSDMRCAGCGAKTNENILMSTLRRIEKKVKKGELPSGVLTDPGKLDDAAILSPAPSGQMTVQSIDFISALVDDPYLFGQIAVEHAFNDILAMGARPKSAQLLAMLPFAAEHVSKELLYQLLTGAMHRLSSFGAELIGGHTSEGPELGLGVVANGFATAEELLDKNSLEEGQILILNKRLGIGTLFAAHMRLKAKGMWIEEAIQSMLLSNAEAMRVFVSCNLSSCTDITGFGLAGHLLTLLKRSGLGADLYLKDLPILSGALECSSIGIESSLSPENRKNEEEILSAPEFRQHKYYPMLFDPQTSGALLAAIPQDRAEECLALLQDKGYPDSRIIGRVRRCAEKPIGLVEL